MSDTSDRRSALTLRSFLIIIFLKESLDLDFSGFWAVDVPGFFLDFFTPAFCLADLTLAFFIFAGFATEAAAFCFLTAFFIFSLFFLEFAIMGYGVYTKNFNCQWKYQTNQKCIFGAEGG